MNPPIRLDQNAVMVMQAVIPLLWPINLLTLIKSSRQKAVLLVSEEVLVFVLVSCDICSMCAVETSVVKATCLIRGDTVRGNITITQAVSVARMHHHHLCVWCCPVRQYVQWYVPVAVCLLTCPPYYTGVRTVNLF